MSKALPVVAYEREHHEPALKRFTEKVLGADVCARRQRVIDTFHDRMPGRDRFPLRHIVLDGETVAGMLGYMPADFVVGGQRVPARYTHDLLVDSAYVGRMLGTVVVRHAREQGCFFPGGMWMTEASHRIHLFCGFDDAPQLTTYTTVLAPGSFVRRHGFSPLKSAVTRAGLGVIRTLALMRAHRLVARAHLGLQTVRVMDAADDAAWFEMAKTYGVTRVRDAAYLNWKYAGHPLLSYRIVVAKDNGRPRGFLVWRPAPEGDANPRAVIVDFLVEKGDARTLQEMTARAMLDAVAAGSDALAVLTTQTFAVSALRPLGFVPGRTRNTWVVANWRDIMPVNWLAELDRWHMCLGDSDGDMWTGAM